ncbi:MAG: SGNH/GDSL hydrolase family protein [Planctomycetota bacterium]|jgi:lysophospholipase L1-like esterase
MKQKRFHRVILAGLFLLFSIIINTSEGYSGNHIRRVDFSKVVFIGDSLTAGFQNGGLSEEGQIHGYAALIAQQAEFDITLPFISEPGIPPKLQLKNVEPLVIEPAEELGARINMLDQATNLAVPGQTVVDAISIRPGMGDPMTDVVLGLPGILNGISKSQIEWAESMEPTFAFVWIGNNDVLGFAVSGGTVPTTPLEDFEQDYQELLDRLEATGADLVLANLPDVTAIAYFTSAEKLAELVGVDLAIIENFLKIQAGDLVTIEGLLLAGQILNAPGSFPDGLPKDMVLDTDEVQQSREALKSFNQIIRREAYRRNIPLVNISRLFKRVGREGVPADGKLLSVNFLGGLFSLDGVHPTHTGYAVVANHFIRKLNFRYRARIPSVDIDEVAKNDPLVIPALLPDAPFSREKLFKAHIRGATKHLRRVICRHRYMAP